MVSILHLGKKKRLLVLISTFDFYDVTCTRKKCGIWIFLQVLLVIHLLCLYNASSEIVTQVWKIYHLITFWCLWNHNDK